jgi:hypothetical protein
MIALLGFATYTLIIPDQGIAVLVDGALKPLDKAIEEFELMEMGALATTCLCGLAAIAPEQIKLVLNTIFSVAIEQVINIDIGLL